jgi:hypothetical protein
MSVSVPLTSFFNDVKIYVTSYFMYRVSHEGKYCTKFLNQYSFICSKFNKLYKLLFLYSKRLHEQKHITTVNSVTNTWSIQQTPMFHGCTITNEVQYLKKINSDLSFFFKVDRGRIQTYLKEGANRGTQTQRLNFIENIISDLRRKKWN